MPDQVSFRRVAACAAAFSLLIAAWLALAPAADAAKLAELRVEGPDGTLDSGTWYVTGKETFKRGKGDACTKRKGTLTFPGANALGILGSADDSNPELSPVRIRTFSFGPFLCGLGGIVGRPFDDPDGFSGWSYWLDYVSGSVAADQAQLAGGDQVLWVFGDFGMTTPVNQGDALELQQVPAGDPDGQFQVKVVAHAFDGTPANVDNATIDGAATATPVGSGGLYNVTIAQGTTTLRATRSLDIPSNQVAACFQPQAADCPTDHGRRIVGSSRDEVLVGTDGWDQITARGGDDRVDLTNGGRDEANCGRGRDRVRVAAGDLDADTIAANCERVVEVE